ncbi:MAG: hypothetical protein LBC03_00815 [Nitrososphaerota archaeon]|nr:hypothetical protein [Nitrososphaerota archaeon]
MPVLVFGFGNLLKHSVDTNQYYYNQLNNSQKTAYKLILFGITSFSKEIKLSIRPINEISVIFESILLDNPLIFYVTSFNYANDLYKKKCIVKPNYKYAKYFVKEHTKLVNRYLQTFDSLKTENGVTKEVCIHDYCLNNFCYDHSLEDYSYSILGPILNKSATCEGISKFVKLAFEYLNIPSLIVHGKAKNPVDDSLSEKHAWNIVMVEGKHYHLDVTFDLSLKRKMNRYDYFNLAGVDIKRDHTIINKVPDCTTIGNDYMSVNSLVVSNPTELAKHIENSLKHSKKNIIVKLQNVQDTGNIVDKVITIAQQQYNNIHKCNVAVEVRYNPSQLVFEINFT